MQNLKATVPDAAAVGAMFSVDNLQALPNRCCRGMPVRTSADRCNADKTVCSYVGDKNQVTLSVIRSVV